MKELDLSESIVKLPVSTRLVLPRIVLKRLLFGHRLAPGSRVLDVGSSSDSLAPKFHELGIDAVTWCPTSTQSSFVDDDETIFAQPNMPDFADQFDLIVVREHHVFQQSLLTSASINTTAKLFENIRAGGAICFLDPILSADETHSDACWERLFELFPGEIHRETVRNLTLQASERLVYRLRSVTLPSTQIDASEWRRIAAQALVHDTNCCERAAGVDERRWAA